MMLPASLPFVVSGMKQGWAFAWRSLHVAEIYVTILTGLAWAPVALRAASCTPWSSDRIILLNHRASDWPSDPDRSSCRGSASCTSAGSPPAEPSWAESESSAATARRNERIDLPRGGASSDDTPLAAALLSRGARTQCP
jgi:hypothetical protein